jgi:oligopeptide/dipeptide ABC transporter ATP-binding protein
MTTNTPSTTPATLASSTVLSVENLQVIFHTEEGALRAVDGVSFDVPRGQILALVGESGCGKSVTAYSILRLIQSPGTIAGGRITLTPQTGAPIDITALNERDKALFHVRGGLVSMVFQEPMTALSPVHTIGDQLTEAILLHERMPYAKAERRAAEMLEKVGIPGAARRLKQYPFEFSGGMRQRVVIAMALLCRPELLIADEPTTALDVTIQAQIMALLKRLQGEMGTSILLITHNLGLVAQLADQVAVMYLGRIVEQAPVRALLKAPRHPYTQGLLASLPGLTAAQDRLPSIPGSVPALNAIPPGCPFHPRCAHAQAGRCDVGTPPSMTWGENGHGVACLRAGEL